MVEIEAKQVYTVECPSLDCAAPHKVVRNGWRNGDQQYLCRGCGKKFAANGQALRKQYPADQIAAAVDMYYSGMSPTSRSPRTWKTCSTCRSRRRTPCTTG